MFYIGFYMFCIGFISFIYVFYMFVISFYRFSTEELRLATGTIRRLSLAKKEVFVVIYRLYTVFIAFQQNFVSTPPPLHCTNLNFR